MAKTNFDELVTELIKNNKRNVIGIKIENHKEYTNLLNELNSRGYKWCNDNSLLYTYYEKSLKYIFIDILLGEVSWSGDWHNIDKGDYIINFSDLTFDFENEKPNKTPIVYISGAISGTTDYMERFEKAENKLKDEGYTVINPAKINSFLPTTTTWEQYMEIDYKLLDICDTIYMLDGWENSKGANAEYDYSIENHKDIMYQNSFSEFVGGVKCDYDLKEKNISIGDLHMELSDAEKLCDWLNNVLIWNGVR